MILRSVISGVVSSSAALVACALLCITSCAVHEWPEPSPADVIVNLDFDTQLPQYKVLNEEGTRASHDGRDYDIRYTIAAYRLLQDGSYTEEPFLLKVFSKDEIEELNASFRFSIDEATVSTSGQTSFLPALRATISTTRPTSATSAFRELTRATTISATPSAAAPT